MKAKTIKMLLYDGDLNGVINISDSSWEIGKMYSAPRNSINALIAKADCKKYGVYLLLSDSQVYVGQSSDLEKRTKQHLTDKTWWTQVVLMTTKDDSFTASDIDYLESRLITLAIKAGTSDSDNRKMGNRQKVDEFRQAELEQYLEEALFLLKLIGIHVFAISSVINPKDKKDDSTNSSNDKKSNNTKSNTIPPLPNEELKIGEFVKTAMQSLSNSGYKFTKKDIINMCSAEWSEKTFHTKHPFMRIHKGKTSTRDENNHVRFWSTPFKFGNITVLISKEWYERQRELFKNWYLSLK